jgi:type II restriction enzyme
MPSCLIERAITDARQYGRALLKFISANDVGSTGSHQCGFYLPKAIWQHFTCNPPERGKLSKEDVKITWQDGLVTNSVITWYGQKTRSEYRLTRFGRDFPWLNEDNVGSLLILIPCGSSKFLAYVADTEDDIDDVLSAFGLSGLEAAWALYDAAAMPPEDPDSCVKRRFSEFVAPLKNDFPSPKHFAEAAFNALAGCFSSFSAANPDTKLLQLLDYEYRLFKLAERRIYSGILTSPFQSIDHFLQIASSIMNRRKARAGASLENHVETVLKDAAIPFASHPKVDKTAPDIIIPSVEAYNDPSYPSDRLFVLALKTTCKDRWRQILNEAPRIPLKHLLTVQQGISQNQLNEISRSNVSLIVPASLHSCYPSSGRKTLLTVEGFVAKIKSTLGN